MDRESATRRLLNNIYNKYFYVIHNEEIYSNSRISLGTYNSVINSLLMRVNNTAIKSSSRSNDRAYNDAGDCDWLSHISHLIGETEIRARCLRWCKASQLWLRRRSWQCTVGKFGGWDGQKSRRPFFGHIVL